MDGKRHNANRGRGGGGRRPPQTDRFIDERQDSQTESNLLEGERTLFITYRDELDTKHDLYERIVKISRDVCQESKRIIFALHRITTATTVEDKAQVIAEATRRLATVRENLFCAIAKELWDEDQVQYNRAICFGLQVFAEYIEAVSFCTFLTEHRLITYAEVKVSLCFPKPEELCVPKPEDTSKPIRGLLVDVSLVDYLCGLGDLGGELMRYAMNSISSGALEIPNDVCRFLQELYAKFVLLGRTVPSKDFKMKVDVTCECLRKVEFALYTLRVRRSEVPEHMLAAFVAKEASSFTANDQQRRYVDADEFDNM